MMLRVMQMLKITLLGILAGICGGMALRQITTQPTMAVIYTVCCIAVLWLAISEARRE